MWFKNLSIYRFTSPIDLSADALEGALSINEFNPCGNMDFSTYGWVSPLGKDSEILTHTVGSCTMFCARKQEKILPAAAINEQLEEKVAALETEQARKVYRKERQNFKDEVVHTLLPRALTRSSLTFAYVDRRSNLLFIDTSSKNKAEELLEHLRASLGSLPVVPLECHGDAASVMTRWVSNHIPRGFELDADCELQNPRESRNTVRCKNQELESDEIMSHLKAGKRVIQLGLIWKTAIHFTLSEDFAIKRLKFADQLKEEAEGAEDKITQFDQDFAVMSIQLAQFIDDLLEEFGGAEQAAATTDAVVA